jgi:hemerythrin superfamily protein
MNALELLMEDHRKVQELFDQVKAIDNQKQHKQLFRKIKTELDTHAHIEEKVFYPTLKKYIESTHSLFCLSLWLISPSPKKLPNHYWRDIW